MSKNKTNVALAVGCTLVGIAGLAVLGKGIVEAVRIKNQPVAVPVAEARGGFRVNTVYHAAHATEAVSVKQPRSNEYRHSFTGERYEYK